MRGADFSWADCSWINLEGVDGIGPEPPYPS